ncbi:hypothetical protein L7F22_025436 [Adiantum nelumboides]|nr:hypothetical protein [Adiantum nelumboides]
MPLLSYSNKLLTLAQQIGSTEKEKLRAFSRGLDASIKYGVRNLKPATYEEALALAENKELELNNGKPKQPTNTTSSQQTNGKSQANKTAKPNTPSKPKMTLDEKAKAGVKVATSHQRSRRPIRLSSDALGAMSKGIESRLCEMEGKTASLYFRSCSIPSFKNPSILEHAISGTSCTQSSTTPGSEEDLISPQLATKLQCTMQPFDLDVDAFTPGIRTRITQIATKVQFSVQQAPFERAFLVSPLTCCDMFIGNPWMTTHVPLIDSKSGTFFITEGVPSPITITCDRSIPGIPIISHLPAKRAIRKGAECALLLGKKSKQGSNNVKLQIDGFSSPFLYRRWYRCNVNLSYFEIDGHVIDRRHNLSLKEFAESYDAKKPILLGGLADRWPAMQNWSLEYLVEHYGNCVFKVGQNSNRKILMCFEDYVYYMKQQHDEEPLYIFDPKAGDVPDDGELDEQPEVEENEEFLVPEQILAP